MVLRVRGRTKGTLELELILLNFILGQRHQRVWGDYVEFCLDRLQTRLDMDEETLARAETTVRIPSVELITSTYPSTLAAPQVRSESRSLERTHTAASRPINISVRCPSLRPASCLQLRLASTSLYLNSVTPRCSCRRPS